MKYVVIGGVAGGASAAARLRRLDEQAEILLLEKGEYISYANCGLPYHIGGVIENRGQLFVQTPESFHARFRVEVRVKAEVMSIDAERHSVSVRDLRDGQTREEHYDKLILSPGAEPVRPPVEGIGLEGVFTLRSVSDMDRIKGWTDRHEVKRAVVVGGGFIGLEMAENLSVRGIRPTVVEMADQVMTPVDVEIAVAVHRHLRARGVGLRLQEAVAAFRQTGEGLEVVLKSGQVIGTDLVVLAVGVRPDTRLAREAGLEIGKSGGIRVNAFLQTSHPDIYAVGDAVETVHPVSGQPALCFLAGPANKQARICADNAVGGNRSVYRGAIGTAIAKVFDLTVGTAGLSARALNRSGIPFQEAIVHAGSHAGYYPGAVPLTLKINFSPADGRLLGAQAVGGDGVDKRLEMLAAVLRAGGTVYDLAELEHAYAPPFSSAKDPVNMLGFVADNLLSGKVEYIGWRELRDADKSGLTLVNVCSPEECALSGLPGELNIPLNELRGRLGELPLDRPVVVYCAVGLRGYIAARILKQHGYRVRNLSGGLKTYEAVASELNPVF